MTFRERNIRAIAEMVIGNVNYFPYRSSWYISRFFEECDLDFEHDGTTRAIWTSERLSELLNEPSKNANTLPERFVNLLRVLMDKAEAERGDDDRSLALEALNKPLNREGYEAFYGDDRLLHLRHIGTKTVSIPVNYSRPLTPAEEDRRDKLIDYLDKCSEDELIENVLLPMFRHLGFHRITATGHKDKALEYGKDLWMKYVLPTQHVLYFGIQAKKGKLDASGKTQAKNTNIAEIYNQALMMLGHEIFDPDTSRRVLVDHAFIIAGGEITKQAKNWLGEKLDATKRSQVMFIDREDILNIFTVSNLPISPNVNSDKIIDDDLPF